MRYFQKRVALVALALCAASHGASASLVENGDFEDGLIGWSVSLATNSATSLVDTQEFDVTGAGASPAAVLSVGRKDPQFDRGAFAFLTQSIFLPEISVYSLSFDYAFVNRSVVQPDLGGRATAIDLAFNRGVPAGGSLAGVTINEPSADQVFRGTISNTIFPKTRTGGQQVGLNTLDVSIFSNFDVSDDVLVYIDNVSVSEVPVPGALALSLGGLGVLLGVGRKRRASPASRAPD